jgi:hypothetical protein
MPAPKRPAKVEPTRSKFRALLATNPNYFGTAPSPGDFPVVAEQTVNTAYEELTCVSYSPKLDRLEATFQVKRPNGYSGDLCTSGSHEHVRFYLDYGFGWQDAGPASVNVHDIPVGTDCRNQKTHPLVYVCGVDHKPKRNWCGEPVLPRVRAILSWNLMPPANQPDWLPPWGNRLECNIQVRPRVFRWPDIFDKIPKDVLEKLDIPDIELAEVPVNPIPDPGPLAETSIAKLAQAYKRAKVPEHRFALPKVAELMKASGDDLQLMSGELVEQLGGIKLEGVLDILDKPSGNTEFEELECLGLERFGLSERLVATFHIKRPSGYSGGPCTKGSVEYVAFWADWDDDCDFEYLGTVETSVHDYAKLPDGGLCYAAVLPVDVNQIRQRCEKPVLPRVRAVLSWGTPPSTTNPDQMPFWGNRLDTHVQIAPGDPYDGTARFVIVGGVPASEIDLATGLTVPGAHLAVNGQPLGSLGRPFAGRVTLHGPTDPALVGSTYRVLLTNVTSGLGPLPLMNGFMTVGGLGQTMPSPTTEWLPAAGGWLPWRGWMENTTGVLGWFDTTGDDLWRIDLELMGSGIVDTRFVQLDNTLNGPSSVDPDNRADLHLDVAGNCDLTAGVMTGTFVARDRHFASWGISVHGGPSGGFPTPPPATVPPVPPGLPTTSQTPPGGRAFELDLSALPPCGYTVRLSVSDLAIANSASTGRTVSVERGLCIREPAP